MENARTRRTAAWGASARHHLQAGVEACREAAIPADPILLNYGLVGALAFAASSAWAILARHL
jgi:hypothetical protein